jgi:hypothetical protein
MNIPFLWDVYRQLGRLGQIDWHQIRVHCRASHQRICPTGFIHFASEQRFLPRLGRLGFENIHTECLIRFSRAMVSGYFLYYSRCSIRPVLLVVCFSLDSVLFRLIFSLCDKIQVKKIRSFFWQIQNMIIMNSWQLFAVLKERELEQSRLQFCTWIIYYLVVDSIQVRSENSISFLVITFKLVR